MMLQNLEIRPINTPEFWVMLLCRWDQERFDIFELTASASSH